MKKKVFFMALAAIVAFTSCDNDVESGSRYLSGYFTNAGSAVDFASTFPLYKMSELIPGKDSVEVTIHIEGAKAQTIKIGRNDLVKGNYLPYKKQTSGKSSANTEATLF